MLGGHYPLGALVCVQHARGATVAQGRPVLLALRGCQLRGLRPRKLHHPAAAHSSATS